MAALGDVIGQVKQLIATRPNEFPAGSNFDQIMAVLQARYPSIYIDVGNALRSESLRAPEWEGLKNEMAMFVQRTHQDIANVAAEDAATKQRLLEDQKATEEAAYEDRVARDVAVRTQSDLSKRIRDLYGVAGKYIESQALEALGGAKERSAADLAATGRLGSGVSARILSNLEAASAKDVLAQKALLAKQQAAEESGLAKTLEDMLQRKSEFATTTGLQKAGLAEQIRQFGQTQALEREKYRTEQDLGERAIKEQGMANLAAQEARKPGILDYLGTAFAGLGALGRAAGGIGSAISAYKAKKQ